MFEFVFRMFATGAAALPAGGIGAVATQLGDSLNKLPNCRYGMVWHGMAWYGMVWHGVV